jgi:hypothetical protein
MKKKRLVFRPTGEVRGVNDGEYYYCNEQLRRCIGYIAYDYPIYSAVEEIVDVPLWRAGYRELYYYITEQGKVSSYNLGGDYVDESMYELGNHFQTEKEAQRYLDLMKFILTERLLDNPEFCKVIEKLKGELA